MPCPYCGETFEALIDTSAGDSSYTEDCYVCCRPIIFNCIINTDSFSGDDDHNITVTTHTEDDSY
ncbi:CPXCG motif-containing cysteine-rich protein [Oceanicoccus sp. KOV_DT_Chl]|uniref:CPXCG motif-containing cysteine-rich protein n=1 Tax=Oceanicoccus sp. KOV_DT_Chl TaxID=1904639 RepID=UPI001F331C02|nr:CPXCG motif-containing cysteine-rich protein [Oceanicoccus sp. KOV_DT_Chl]